MTEFGNQLRTNLEALLTALPDEADARLTDSVSRCFGRGHPPPEVVRTAPTKALLQCFVQQLAQDPKRRHFVVDRDSIVTDDAAWLTLAALDTPIMWSITTTRSLERSVYDTCYAAGWKVQHAPGPRGTAVVAKATLPYSTTAVQQAFFSDLPRSVAATGTQLGTLYAHQCIVRVLRTAPRASLTQGLMRIYQQPVTPNVFTLWIRHHEHIDDLPGLGRYRYGATQKQPPNITILDLLTAVDEDVDNAERPTSPVAYDFVQASQAGRQRCDPHKHSLPLSSESNESNNRSTTTTTSSSSSSKFTFGAKTEVTEKVEGDEKATKAELMPQEPQESSVVGEEKEAAEEVVEPQESGATEEEKKSTEVEALTEECKPMESSFGEEKKESSDKVEVWFDEYEEPVRFVPIVDETDYDASEELEEMPHSSPEHTPQKVPAISPGHTPHPLSAAIENEEEKESKSPVQPISMELAPTVSTNDSAVTPFDEMEIKPSFSFDEDDISPSTPDIPTEEETHELAVETLSVPEEAEDDKPTTPREHILSNVDSNQIISTTSQQLEEHPVETPFVEKIQLSTPFVKTVFCVGCSTNKSKVDFSKSQLRKKTNVRCTDCVRANRLGPTMNA